MLAIWTVAFLVIRGEAVIGQDTMSAVGATPGEAIAQVLSASRALLRELPDTRYAVTGAWVDPDDMLNSDLSATDPRWAAIGSVPLDANCMQGV